MDVGVLNDVKRNAIKIKKLEKSINFLLEELQNLKIIINQMTSQTIVISDKTNMDENLLAKQESQPHFQFVKYLGAFSALPQTINYYKEINNFAWFVDLDDFLKNANQPFFDFYEKLPKVVVVQFVNSQIKLYKQELYSIFYNQQKNLYQAEIRFDQNFQMDWSNVANQMQLINLTYLIKNNQPK